MGFMEVTHCITSEDDFGFITKDFLKSCWPWYLVKANDCQSQAKYLAKTFETMIKTIYLLLWVAEYPHLIFC